MSNYTVISNFNGTCPTCQGQCTAETVETVSRGSTVSRVYAGCDSCGWEGPAELTRVRPVSPSVP